MECSRFRTNLPDFVTDELPTEERTWCALHARTCPDCALLLETEQGFNLRVQGACIYDAYASIGFATRVQAALAAERGRQARTVGLNRWRWTSALGMAAALLIGLYSWHWWPQPNLSIYQAAVRDHLYDLAERIRLPGGPKTSAEIESFAQGVSGITNLVPRISPPGFRLIKVRACRLDGIVFGHFIYEKDGRHVSIYVRPKQGELTGAVLETVSDIPLRGCTLADLQSVALQTARLTFVVVADPAIADARALARALAATHFS